MATAFTSGNWNSNLSWIWTDTRALIPDNTVNSNSTGKSRIYTNGTGILQANKIFNQQYTISASGNLVLRLTGALLDYAYTVINFTTVKEIYIALEKATTASTILVGGGTDGAGTNAFATWLGAAAHQVRCGNGAPITASRPDATGFAVTASTGDALRILNEDSVNSATVTVSLLGCG